ncbi:PdaC/SigV domain-containing protein [Arcobacter aquimarinus]|uniref:PdaC/SigV domain-containing protein n=1 Tax=Arcobacter aquimarinus TaxID=1315211 RepID=UPI003BB05401
MIQQLIYNKRNRLFIVVLWFILITYFLIQWAIDDKSFETGVAILTLFASNIFSIMIPTQKDTFKVDITEKEIKLKLKYSDDSKVIYPIFKYKDNTSIERKINNLINFIYLRLQLDIKNKIPLKDSLAEELGDFSSEYEVTYKNENILSLKFLSYFYYKGAAHGNSEIITLNINLLTGEEFEFKDIFRSYGYEPVEKIVKEKLLEHDCKDMYFDFESIHLRVNQNFYINNNDNLVIVFFKYEIGPGCCDIIEIEVNRKDFLDFINPNGPLSLLYSKYTEDRYIDKGHTFDYIFSLHKRFKF